MEAPAVGLYDHAVAREEQVDLEPGDGRVDDAGAAQGRSDLVERRFKRGAGRGRRNRGLDRERVGARVARVGGDRLFDLAPIEQAELVGLVQRVAQPGASEGGCDVEQGTAGVVTVIASWTVASSGPTPRWSRRPGRWARPFAVGTLTSTYREALGRMPQSAAADAWLRAAPGPQLSVAASQRPCPLTRGCPSA